MAEGSAGRVALGLFSQTQHTKNYNTTPQKLLYYYTSISSTAEYNQKTTYDKPKIKIKTTKTSSPGRSRREIVDRKRVAVKVQTLIVIKVYVN